MRMKFNILNQLAAISLFVISITLLTMPALAAPAKSTMFNIEEILDESTLDIKILQDWHVDEGSMEVYGMVGNVCFVLGAVLLGCVFVPATKIAPASINVLAAAILLVLGWLLRRMAR